MKTLSLAFVLSILLSASSFAEGSDYIVGTITKIVGDTVEVETEGNSLRLKLAQKVVCDDRELELESSELKKCLEELKGQEVQIISDNNKLLEVNLLEEIPQ